MTEKETIILEKEAQIASNIEELSKLNSEFKQAKSEILAERERCEIALLEHQKYIHSIDDEFEFFSDATRISELGSKIPQFKQLQEVHKNIQDLKNELKQQKFGNNTMETNKLSALSNYDLGLSIKSLNQLVNNLGWPLYKKCDLSKSILDGKYCVIGLLGIHNSGKTWLTSQLSNISLPFGYNRSTKGISVLYDSKNGAVFLDTKPYLECLKLPNENDTSQDMFNSIVDQSNSDVFLREYIINTANIVLIVLNELTIYNQNLINKIKFEIKELKDKRVFVIHNYQNLYRIDDIRKQVANDILKAFPAQCIYYSKVNLQDPTANLNSEYFIDKDSINPFIHIVFAKENSEAGRYFNMTSINILNSAIIDITSKYQYFNFEESLVNSLKSHIPKYYSSSSSSSSSSKHTDVSVSVSDKSIKSITMNCNGEISYHKTYINVAINQDDNNPCVINTSACLQESTNGNAFIETNDYFIWQIEANGLSLEEIQKAKLIVLSENNGFCLVLKGERNENKLMKTYPNAQCIGKPTLSSITNPNFIFKTGEINPGTRIKEFGNIKSNLSRELIDGMIILKWKKCLQDEN